MADLPALTARLLDLFNGPLHEVRFPDADGDRLGAAVAALAEAEATLEAARVVLVDKQRLVAQETERTLAYARVYAADRPELRAALEAVSRRPRHTNGRKTKRAEPDAAAVE